MLPVAALLAAFPFHLWLDAELRVIAAGEALARLLPELRPGVAAFECLALRRPALAAVDAASLRAVRGSVTLELRGTGMPLRGQVLALDHGELVVLGEPWVDDTRELAGELERQGRALLESQHRISTHLRQTPLGVIDWDREGRVVAWNPAAERIFGIPAAEAIGRGVEQLGLVGPVDADAGQAPGHAQAAHSREGASAQPRFDLLASLDRRVVVEHRPAERSPVLCAWHNTRLVDLEGRAIGVSSILRDVTESVRGERALREAQKLESLGLFAGGIAHDFNNLLMALVGNVDLALRDGGQGGGAAAHLSEIAGIAERAAELTRQLLEVSGQAVPDLAPVSLTELVTQAEGLLAATLPARVRLRVELPAAPLPAIAGDLVRLRRVLGDLVVNASEAIGERSGEIRMAVEGVRLSAPLDIIGGASAGAGGASGGVAGGPLVRGGPLAPGDYVRLTVSDDGVGMSAELQERIFDPFFSTKFTGRGLGLAAILGIVRGHQGAMRLESAPDQGTRFELYFPALAPLAASPSAAANQRPGQGPGPRLGRQRLLVVDDEAQVRRVLTTALSGAGFEVIEAEAGRRALELYDSDPHGFDLVLTDLTMPGLDGHELFCELTARDPRLPVILSSGYSDHQGAARYPDGTPATFLKKPYRLGHLLAKINQALARTGSDP